MPLYRPVNFTKIRLGSYIKSFALHEAARHFSVGPVALASTDNAVEPLSSKAVSQQIVFTCKLCVLNMDCNTPGYT